MSSKLSRTAVVIAALVAAACGGPATAPPEEVPSSNVPPADGSATLSVQPPVAQTAPGSQVAFSAAVAGAVNTSVTWSVQEGPQGGTIDSAGTYRAPATLGVYHVVATAVAEPTVSQVVPVTVTAAVDPNPGPAYYVSKSGNDGGTGSIGSPWATLRHAISQLAAGDTLYIRAGTWTEDAWSSGSLPAGTGESQRVTFAAYPGEVVVLQPTSASPGALYLVGQGNQYITFKGLVWDGSNLNGAGARNTVRFDPTQIGGLEMPHHIRFDGGEVRFGRSTSCFQVATHDSEFLNLDVHHCGCTDNHDHAYYISGHRNVLRGGKVHDNLQAIQIWNEYCEGTGRPCDGIPGDNTIDGVEFYNDGLNPWCMSSPLPAGADLGVIGVFQGVMGSGTTITNCNIHDNRLSGIRVGEYAARPQNVTISNNRIVDNGSVGGTGIYFLGPSSGSSISGNVLSGNPAAGNQAPGNQIYTSDGSISLSNNTAGP